MATSHCWATSYLFYSRNKAVLLYRSRASPLSHQKSPCESPALLRKSEKSKPVASLRNPLRRHRRPPCEPRIPYFWKCKTLAILRPEHLGPSCSAVRYLKPKRRKVKVATWLWRWMNSLMCSWHLKVTGREYLLTFCLGNYLNGNSHFSTVKDSPRVDGLHSCSPRYQNARNHSLVGIFAWFWLLGLAYLLVV